MKITLLLPLLMIALHSSAQKDNYSGERENFFRAGAKAGVNINKISGKTYKEGFRYNFQAGIFMQFNVSGRFGIQPEVNFVQTSSEFSDDAGSIYDDLFRDGSQKTSRLDFLEVPVLLNINIGESKRFKLQIGPSYGNLLKQTVDSLKANGDIYKNGEWAALAGIWIQIPFVNMGARYRLGLTNLNGIDNRQEWKSQAIHIFVGVTF